MCKCEREVVRNFALDTKKLTHSLCPIDKANNYTWAIILKVHVFHDAQDCFNPNGTN